MYKIVFYLKDDANPVDKNPNDKFLHSDFFFFFFLHVWKFTKLFA